MRALPLPLKMRNGVNFVGYHLAFCVLFFVERKKQCPGCNLIQPALSESSVSCMGQYKLKRKLWSVPSLYSSRVSWARPIADSQTFDMVLWQAVYSCRLLKWCFLGQTIWVCHQETCLILLRATAIGQYVYALYSFVSSVWCSLGHYFSLSCMHHIRCFFKASFMVFSQAPFMMFSQAPFMMFSQAS